MALIHVHEAIRIDLVVVLINHVKVDGQVHHRPHQLVNPNPEAPREILREIQAQKTLAKRKREEFYPILIVMVNKTEHRHKKKVN